MKYTVTQCDMYSAPNPTQQKRIEEDKTMDKALQTYIAVLKAEIDHLKSKLPNEDTSISILKSTISTLTQRVKELESRST